MKKIISISFSIFNLIFTQFITGQNSQKNSSDELLGEKVDSIIQMGIREKAFPGAQVFLFKDDSIKLFEAYGFHTYDSITPVAKNDLYDLASVTKIIGSTLAFMKLYELYGINLDQKVSEYMPLTKRSNKKNTTFREVLAHQAGWSPYITHQNTVFRKNGEFKSRTLSNKKSNRYPYALSDSLYIFKNYQRKIMQRIKKTPVENIGKYRYSGLWFFLLPELVKNLSGLSFDAFLDTHFFQPLEAKRLTFNPSLKFKQEEIVPTEKDSLFRKTLVKGWVHDEAAGLMGGVSGNAGLFSDAKSLSKILQMLLNKGTYKGKKYLKAETIELFSSQAYPSSENRRGLGFDKPSLDSDSSSYPSEICSPESYGHSGFTGTFVWINPTHNSFMIFLSNRVFPTRAQKAIYSLGIRGKILDVLLEN